MVHLTFNLICRGTIYSEGIQILAYQHSFFPRSNRQWNYTSASSQTDQTDICLRLLEQTDGDTSTWLGCHPPPCPPGMRQDLLLFWPTAGEGDVWWAGSNTGTHHEGGLHRRIRCPRVHSWSDLVKLEVQSNAWIRHLFYKKKYINHTLLTQNSWNIESSLKRGFTTFFFIHPDLFINVQHDFTNHCKLKILPSWRDFCYIVPFSQPTCSPTPSVCFFPVLSLFSRSFCMLFPALSVCFPAHSVCFFPRFLYVFSRAW